MWGSLAAAAVGAFLAEMLRRRREPAGEREISDYQMKIRARKQAELEAQWAREAAKKQSQARTAALDAKIEREEQKEEAAWEAWKSRSQTLAAQRAEQQRQQAAAAYQAYRQGEWAEPQQSKPWWQRAGDWLQQKVLQPVQQHLTPQRVQQSLQPIFAPIGSSAQPSKKREKAPGWPRGKLRSPKQRYGMVKKTPVAAKTA